MCSSLHNGAAYPGMGYETYRRPPPAGWGFVAELPCGNTGYIGQTGAESIDACTMACQQDSNCSYVSYCSAAKGTCAEGHVDVCAMYTGCSSLHTGSVYPGMGYETYRHPPPAGWRFVAELPCDSIGYLDTSGTQESLDACAAACQQDSACNFASFCSADKGNCDGGNANKCAMYSTCASLVNNGKGYETWRRPPIGPPGWAFV